MSPKLVAVITGIDNGRRSSGTADPRLANDGEREREDAKTRLSSFILRGSGRYSRRCPGTTLAHLLRIGGAGRLPILMSDGPNVGAIYWAQIEWR